jgi:pyrroline-5-carboxylate reductase
MASAFMGGLLGTGMLKEEEVFLTDASDAALKKLSDSYPAVSFSTDNLAFLDRLDFLVLSVKPHIYEPVILQIRDQLRPETVIITIAAGKTRAQVRELFGREIKLVRTMPNTPALVGEGMIAVCPGDTVTSSEREKVLSLIAAVGRTELLDEPQFDAFTGLCGSGPAYVYLFIEAMADAAVREGLPRDKAYLMASQTVLGSAKMVMETGMHPGVLKDQVCSPGGTTIEAVGVLEEKGFRSSVMEAIRACTLKSRALSQS